jgi:hypothetical protein
MYCPRCATEFQDGSPEAYCRGCGFELSPVTSLVTGEEAKPPSRRSPVNSPLMRLGMALFILGLVVALLNAALSGLLGVPEVYGKTFFLVMVAVGMGCLGLGMLMPRRQKAKTQKANTFPSQRSAPNALNTPAVTNNLPPLRADQFEIPSVTEDTTRNLR